MATIRPNDNALAQDAEYNLPGAKFTLGPGDSYETDDRAVLSDAETHPFLIVEYPEQPQVSVSRESGSVPYEDDYLTAPNSRAFDLEEVERVETEKHGTDAARLAVQSGLDQNKQTEIAGIGVTLAADDAITDKPARKSSKKEN